MKTNYHLLFAKIINKELKERITGQFADRINNNLSPEELFFASRISPASDEFGNDYGRSTASSFGFDFYVDKESLLGNSIIYYPRGEFYFRIEPNLEEQQSYMLDFYSREHKQDFREIDEIQSFLKKHQLTEIADIKLVACYQKVKLQNKKIEINFYHKDEFTKVFNLEPYYSKFVYELQESIGNLQDVRLYRPYFDSVTLADVESSVSWQKLLARITNQPYKIQWDFSFDLRTKEVSDKEVLISVSFTNESLFEKGAQNKKERVNTIFNVGIDLNLLMVQVKPTPLWHFKDDFRYENRNQVFAVGRNCSVNFDETRNTFSTTMLPEYHQKRLVTNEKIIAKFTDLIEDPQKKLLEIYQAMNAELELWKQDFKRRKPQLSEKAIEGFNNVIKEFNNEINRFYYGITILGKYSKVNQAFTLMNQVFAKASLSKGFNAWRLFQIVYIVSVLPDLASREYSEIESPEMVDLIYFPTGGGKTETYLGTVIFNMFFDRLRGKHAGVTAIIKFPLRLLSLQQLERATNITAQANLVLNPIKNSDDEYFTVGYYVGDGNTPNKLNDIAQYNELTQSTKDEKFKLIDTCPYCFNKDVHIQIDVEKVRIIHLCWNVACPNPDINKHLPLFISDSEVYRYLPTFIVSTLDKSAILGLQRKFRQILGYIDQKCTIHGYTSTGKCPEDDTSQSTLKGLNMTCNGQLKKVKIYDPSPSILIQDELHLVRESLGAYNSHYETYIRKLIEIINGRKKSIKIISSSATISEFKEHVYHLYHLPARRFPEASPYTNKNFYAFELEDVARIIVGFYPNGEQIIIALQYMIQHLREIVENYSKNPELLRKKDGFENITSEDFRSLLKTYHVILEYNQKKSDGNQVLKSVKDINERLKRNGYSVIDDDKCRSMTGDDTFLEVKKTLADIDSPASSFPEVDVIAATNMISHGVDSSSLNEIIFYGVPKTTAEYIQAYSRVGRTFPGLVYMLFNMNKEKDRSYFHNFVAFNKYKDILVESVPINRWANQALERTLPGLISGYILGIIDPQYPNEKLYMYKRFKDFILSNKDKLVDEISQALKDSYIIQADGTVDPLGGFYDKRITEILENMLVKLNMHDEKMDFLTTGLDKIGMHVMNSFRDIEDTVSIIADTHSSALMKGM